MDGNHSEEISSWHIVERNKNDIHCIAEIFRKRNNLSGRSSIIDAYERTLAQTCKVKEAIAVSSGTAALHTALYTLGVSPGDEVIVSILGVVMTALPILHLGATPIFTDVSPCDFSLDTEEVSSHISEKTKAIITVPMWGYATHEKELYRLGHQHSIPVITDAAHAIGTQTDGFFVGTEGSCGCFSTHELKMLSTGEGGFILTNDAALAKQCRIFLSLGRNECFGDQIGLNYKLNGMAAALGCRELQHLDKKILRRKRLAQQWVQELKSLPEMIPFPYKQETLLNGYAQLFC